MCLLAILTGLITNYFRPDSLKLPGDWSIQSKMTLDSGDRIDISFEDAQKLFFSNEAIFLDARPQSEYENGHIQGAKAFPWAEFDFYFENVMADIPEEAAIITYCDGPTCTLSKDLAKALIEMGFSNVRVLVNGWSIWKNNKLPIEN